MVLVFEKNQKHSFFHDFYHPISLIRQNQGIVQVF